MVRPTKRQAYIQKTEVYEVMVFVNNVPDC
jgi:hypothetical protein